MSEIRTPYDDLPIEVRRESFGWFGPPWPSGVCYGDDGRLLEDMRKPFPAGESCLHCGELLDEAAGDSGRAMPGLSAAGTGEIRHAHKECLLRMITGSLAHLERRCTCFGGTDHDGWSRADALAVWDWVQRHGAVAE